MTNHIIDSRQFDTDFLEKLFAKTKEIKKNPKEFSNNCKTKVCAMLFYEASTRTRMSFESAMFRLGGSCITTESAAQFSSATKGENLKDTIRIVSQYADFIVLRHYEDDFSNITEVTDIPIINAGSGKSHHPTQALLDVFTIQNYFPSLSNLKIAVVGDLLRGRTCKSLVSLLSHFPDNHFFFVGPDNSRISKDIKQDLEKKNIDFLETQDLNSVLPDIDICYMTRIQKERFASYEEYLAAKGKVILNKKNLPLLNSKAIILHPLPRVDEIAPEVDFDPRAKYFEQAKNGLFIRMALFEIIK
jgi:aspartate carbamoyltransferase catalytic subunit